MNPILQPFGAFLAAREERLIQRASQTFGLLPFVGQRVEIALPLGQGLAEALATLGLAGLDLIIERLQSMLDVLRFNQGGAFGSSPRFQGIPRPGIFRR